MSEKGKTRDRSPQALSGRELAQIGVYFFCERCNGTGRIFQWRGYAEICSPCPECTESEK